MASRKTKDSAPLKDSPAALESIGTVFSTFSGPSTSKLDDAAASKMPDVSLQRLATQKVGAQMASASVPFNPLQPFEFGLEGGHAPHAGEPGEPHDSIDSASTVTEDVASTKLGEGKPVLGYNPGNESLDRVRVDASGQTLTTNMGIAVGDNQNSLKAGLRGPTLLEDFILREKVTHFDHERIPERIVHARGSAAHGYFESYQDLSPITKAAPFAEAAKRLRRCSCASPPSPVSAALPTWRATCAASR